MTVTNSPKEVSLPQIYLSTDYWLELTILKSFVTYTFVSAYWTLRWITNINLNGCITWFWWPTNNANIGWFHIYECALFALSALSAPRDFLPTIKTFWCMLWSHSTSGRKIQFHFRLCTSKPTISVGISVKQDYTASLKSQNSLMHHLYHHLVLKIT